MTRPCPRPPNRPDHAGQPNQPGRPGQPSQPRPPMPYRCDCNGPCMCAAPVPLLRWFAAQVSVYHGPVPARPDAGQCGQPLRMCGICMLVAALHRAARERWRGILP